MGSQLDGEGFQLEGKGFQLGVELQLEVWVWTRGMGFQLEGVSSNQIVGILTIGRGSD